MADDFGTEPFDQYTESPLPGSLVLLESPSNSPSEFLLHDIVNGKRAYYYTTLNKNAVEKQFENSKINPDTTNLSISSSLKDIFENREDQYDVFVIDTASCDLWKGSSGTDEISETLISLSEVAKDKGAYVLIHHLSDSQSSNITLIRRVVDITAEVTLDQSSSSLSYRFAVTKNRFSSPMDKHREIRFADTIEIDASRDIG